MKTQKSVSRIRRNGVPRSIEYNGYTVDYNKYGHDEFTVIVNNEEVTFESMKEVRTFVNSLSAPKTMTREENEMWVNKLGQLLGYRYKVVFDANSSGLTFVYKDGKLIHKVPNEDITGESPLYKYM